MEPRRLLTTWTFNGTGNADTISLDVIGVNVVITLNGSPQSMSDATVTDIVINGLGGGDAINVIRTGDNLTEINCGDGDDTVRVGHSTENLANIDAALFADGQTGSDTLLLLDSSSGSGVTYDFTSTVFSRTSMPSLIHGAVESITLSAGSLGDTISVRAVQASLSLSLNCGDGDDTTNVGSTTNTLEDIAGSLTVSGQGGTADALVVNDAGNSAPASYAITSSTVSSPGMGTLTYSLTVESLRLESGSNADTINVESTRATTPLVVNCNNGNDDVHISPTNQVLSQVDGAMSIDGGNGTDSLTLRDNANPAQTDYTITATTVTVTGMGSVTYTALETMTLGAGNAVSLIHLNGTAAATAYTLNGNDGSDTVDIGVAGNPQDIVSNINVNAGNQNDNIRVIAMSASATLTVNGDAGNDQVDVGAEFSNGLSPIDGAMIIDGMGGNDFLILNDLVHSASRSFTVTSSTVTATGMGALNYSSIELMDLWCGSAADVIDVVGTGPPLNLLAGAGLDVLNVNTDGIGVATVALPFGIDDENFASINIFSGGRLEAVGLPGFLFGVKTQSFALSATGVLDLNGNALIVDYTPPDPSPLSSIQSLLTSGYAGGTWNGNGINSSVAASTPGRALGYAESAAIFSTFPAIFANHPVDNTAVLVRYTRVGDADLSGNVNLNDFNRLAANFGASNTGWSQGNFNFDNLTNLIDFNALAANFGLAASPAMRGGQSPPIWQSIFSDEMDEERS